MPSLFASAIIMVTDGVGIAVFVGITVTVFVDCGFDGDSLLEQFNIDKTNKKTK